MTRAGKGLAWLWELLICLLKSFHLSEVQELFPDALGSGVLIRIEIGLAGSLLVTLALPRACLPACSSISSPGLALM